MPALNLIRIGGNENDIGPIETILRTLIEAGLIELKCFLLSPGEYPLNCGWLLFYVRSYKV